ncbi:MAG: TPM domain-containing protein [Oscillospiraceae bacterium]
MKNRIFALLSVLVISITFCLPTFATSNTHPPRLVDNADLLSETEESDLLSKLDEISVRQNNDVVILTVNSLEGKTATEYADDFFDYNYYGQGSEQSGILFLVSMSERKWAISTKGYCIPAFTDAGQKYIIDKIKPDLSDGNYNQCFNDFADLCDDFLTQAASGSPYDINNLPRDIFSGMRILFALGIGIIIARVVVTIKKSKLKTVRMQPAAQCYVKQGSMNITNSNDLFLYSRTTRTRRAQNSSRSGGSSTHHSSSGSRHGGSSGSF